MATVLVPTYRFEFSYVVTGLLHKLRHYVMVDTSTPVKIMTRSPGTPIAVADAATGFLTTLEGGYPDGNPSAFSWVFQHLVSGVWLPEDSGSMANANTVTTPVHLAAQVTGVLRDTAFKKVRVILLESIIDGPFHVSTLAAAIGINAALGSIFAQYGSTATVTNPPHTWVVGRSGSFLANDPIVGLTWDLNDKLRRARNLV